MTPDPDLRVLARFLPVVESADFNAGEWAPVRRLEDGAFHMPFVIWSDATTEFVQAAYDGGWVLQEFNWPEWAASDEAQAFAKDPERIAAASARQLAQLLTIFIRQDRFVEGALTGAFESGHIPAIVRRAANLLDVNDPSKA